MTENFALFRFPGETDIHFIGSNKLKPLELINIQEEKGFILHPYHSQKAHLIPLDNYTLNPDDDIISGLKFNFKKSEYESSTKESFIKYVGDCIEEIKTEKLKKVVPAKVKIIEKGNDPVIVFKSACEKYPNAFITLTSTVEYGTWIGATPEVLLSIDDNNVMRTVALAGTQPSNGKLPSEAVWTQKEIEEQALVSRYIINCFKHIRLREFEEDGPKTVKAGNLLHLKTTYKINLNDLEFSDLGTTLLNLLHPTSAVSGMPKSEAMNFIQSHEKFDRKLYTGFLGPINFNEESRLFVNLRCGQINDNSITLYAGAGITEDSNPEKEWLETEYKCNIIESLIQ